VKKFADKLKAARDEIATTLMWEICKNKSAAYKEVDRTVVYIMDTIAELKKMENSSTAVVHTEGVVCCARSGRGFMLFNQVAQIKRSSLGVVLCAAPYNYPLNETYTTLIPALIMGNVVILKTPTTGALCHQPTLKMFAECFPPGVVNIIHGAGMCVCTRVLCALP
jgi:glyceraldehyde-3-phosphate dehydrogenase (NADP+)